jgi:hypothetical protein
MAAKQRVAQLQAEAKKMLAELDRRLSGGDDQPTSDADYAGSVSAPHGPAAVAGQPTKHKPKGPNATGPKRDSDGTEVADDESDGESGEPTQQREALPDAGSRIPAIFREYDRLIAKYGELPAVGADIKAHVAKLRRQPAYAAVLNEPAAAALWKQGGQYERDNHLCCAYWTYKKAAELLPAPSAVLANNRFTDLAKKPQVVASAESCRNLKWCHQAYLRAQRLLEARPERAKEIFAEIVARAPEDSEVHRAAKRRI